MFSGGINKQKPDCNGLKEVSEKHLIANMSKYGRKLYICQKKETPPSQKVIHNPLQNCPNFRGLPPLAGRHK